MSFITKVGTWFKTHIIVTIIIGVVAVGGVTTTLLLVGGNASKLNPDANSNNLPDGTYSCELRYNGKSLDTDQEIKDYFNKLYSKLGDTIDVDSRIKDLRIGVESFRKYQIVKDGNIVELMVPNKNNNYMVLFSYDITNDKLTPRNTSGVSTDEKLWQLIDNSIDIKQTGTDFTFGNYYITITMYLPMILSGSNDYDVIEKIEKQLSNIGNLGGDLVCGSNISSSSDNTKEDNLVVDNETIYEKILTQNRQYLMGLVDTPPDGNIDYVFPELEEDIKVHLAYTFYDLNHDGKDELIIGQDGSYYGNDYIRVFSIYKYDNKGKVEVVPIGGGNKNNAFIDILEDGYFEVEYGWQSNQSRSIYGNMKEDNKVVSNWNDLGELVKYDFYEDSNSNWELRLDVYKKGKLVESHKSVTWDAWSEIQDKPLVDFTSKRGINLSNLKWEYILPLD